MTRILRLLLASWTDIRGIGFVLNRKTLCFDLFFDLFLTMNFVIRLSKQSSDPLGYRLLDPQLLLQCYDEIHDQ